MQFINVKTNVSINKEKEENIKREIGNSMNIIGKSESWLMMNFEDNQRMYFGGSNESAIAFVEVNLYGSAGPDAYNKLTAKITEIINKELQILPNKIYIKYFETGSWGFNGSNF